MADAVEYKTPGSVLSLYEQDFTEELPGDTSLHTSNSIVTAFNAAGDNWSTTLVAGVTVSGMKLQADLQAGLNGEDYKVIYKATGASTAKAYEKIVEVRVRDFHLGGV